MFDLISKRATIKLGTDMKYACQNATSLKFS